MFLNFISFQTFGGSYDVFSSWNPRVKRHGNQSSCKTVICKKDLLVYLFLLDVHLFFFCQKCQTFYGGAKVEVHSQTDQNCLVSTLWSTWFSTAESCLYTNIDLNYAVTCYRFSVLANAGCWEWNFTKSKNL